LGNYKVKFKRSSDDETYIKGETTVPDQLEKDVLMPEGACPLIVSALAKAKKKRR